VVALSGYGQARDKAMSAAAGFDAHAVKPVDMTELNQLLGH
jgi:two-component system, chemotaxis family, CheB/CheR fusion protein